MRQKDTSWERKWSGRQDSNLRPPGPKPGALPACATPRLNLTKSDENALRFRRLRESDDQLMPVP